MSGEDECRFLVLSIGGTGSLRLNYQNSIADAVADLGRGDEIAKPFAGFQKYLYQRAVARAVQASARPRRHT